MSNQTIKAARIHEYGGADQIKVEDAPRPVPGEGQVLVRIKATGVNPADWKMRQGWYKDYFPLQFPWTPGLDAAGVVEAVGPGVTQFKPGDEVFGFLNASYAEYAVTAEAELQIKPANITFQEAASIPVGALTAWGALEEARVQAGQRVLIQGGAGGVGLYAVQLAKAKGAYVIATASGVNVDYVKSLGADEVVDYTKTKFEDAVKNVDVVIDTVGGELINRSFDVIRPDGVFVTVAGMVDPEAAQARNIRGSSAGRASADKLKQVAELVAANKLKTQVGPVFPLAQAREAQELSQTGHGRGRIVLNIN